MPAPTLLVGLGGTGSKIVLRVSRLVTESQRRHIGFTIFDTDINELREIREANPFVHTIQTSTRLSVGEYLNIDTHARDEWFPVNAILNSKTLTEGAGQVRAISRLALDTAIRAGNMNVLHTAIENLYKVEEEDSEQALRVVIVSSLAGGTGSGLILPVALYIKNFLATRFQQSANIIRGFFILPEVFFEVIRGQTERNNLMCNAYATLRELDAFLMKGDGTLPEKYEQTARIEFPRVGSHEFDEYHVRPYDYCFLFDAQNTSGRKLNDFNQYLDHAANCIYSQSIGPMNKRSNSSEDNTIRELCAQRGRNRYAGAGCSMLVYPVEDVKEYVALKWTQQTVSEQWLKFDRMYLEKVKSVATMRNQGLSVRDISAAQDYIQTVEALCAQKDPFAVSIVDQCALFDEDGLNRISNSWESYLTQLLNFVESSGEGQSSERQKALNAIDGITGGSDSWQSLVDAYKEMARYYQAVRKHCESVAPNLAYTIFKAQGDHVTKEKRGYQLETYLRDAEGRFIHPNAVRYFLYQCQDCLKAEWLRLDVDYNEVDSFFDSFETDDLFDDKSTVDVQETVEQLTNRKLPLVAKLSKKLTSDQEDIKELFNKYMTRVEEYRNLTLKRDVIKEGMDYVQRLCDAFESFYRTFESKTLSIGRRLGEIAKKYQHTQGKTTRYVCATASCMDKLVERIPFTGSAITIDGDLSDEIYSKVRSFAMISQEERPDNGRYYSDLFDEGIVGYFSRKMMQTYGPQIDMDILTALEQEAEFEGKGMESAKQEQYVKQIIENTRKMSTPFIEKPMGEQREPISACTYNPSIDPNDGSPRSELIAKELCNHGGTPDADIGRNMIMFYQSIYGLRANKLSKFAPEVPGVHGMGAYYKAYYELVNQVTPNYRLTPVITPHIDRNWHLITHLPDLDETNQKAQETRIYRAFVLGLIYHYIIQKPISDARYLYKLEVEGCLPEDFVVSNRTPCDLFYEVLDALSINPVVVTRLVQAVERRMTKELNAKVQFEDSEFVRQLNRLRIVEYERKNVEAFHLDRVSIFDFPALLNVSAPDGTFDISQGCDLLRVELDEVYRYVKSMTEPNALNDTFEKFIVGQYAIFCENRRTFSHYDKLVWLMGELKRMACERLRELELDDGCQAIDELDRRCTTDAPSERQGSLAEDEDDEDEVRAIAGSSASRTDVGDRMISLAEHEEEVSALRKTIAQMEKQYASLSQEMDRRLTTLSQQMERIQLQKNDDPKT